MIREAKQYIQDNFQDPDLSVEKICRHLHMSPAYFQRCLRRRRTGVHRLSDRCPAGRAVELLMATDDKTYIIAERSATRSRTISVTYLRKIRCFPDAVSHGTPERGGIMGKKDDLEEKAL